jgi:hypothetical protein
VNCDTPIRFLQSVTVWDGRGNVVARFDEGQTVRVAEASARHWTRRGVAVEVCEEAREIVSPAPPPAEPDTGAPGPSSPSAIATALERRRGKKGAR